MVPAVLALSLATVLLAKPIEALCGAAGTTVASRLLGILVAALAA